MNDAPASRAKAFEDAGFMASPEARTLRILAEYLEPAARFEQFNVSDTIVFFGSSHMVSRDEALRRLEAAGKDGGDLAAAETNLLMSRYYEDCRRLAFRLTEWSKNLEDRRRRFVVCTGGGPGIMEAANRGASEAKGINIGLNIEIPDEQEENPYITRELAFHFHYFFMRKFWFVYLAKAVIIFPGGFGTLDEFFELMTLNQTRKLKKSIPIVLYGSAYWDQVIDFAAMIRHGTIAPGDVELFHVADSVDEAFDFVTKELAARALALPGGAL
jgi:uncharacterized protein (TIGR00730 family)